MLDIIRSTDRNAIYRLLQARTTSLAEAEAVVRPILDDIRRQGDRALRRYARKFDRLDLRKAGFTVSRDEIRRAYRKCSARLRGGAAGGGREHSPARRGASCRAPGLSRPVPA